jgi:hypothetical protein
MHRLLSVALLWAAGCAATTPDAVEVIGKSHAPALPAAPSDTVTADFHCSPILHGCQGPVCFLANPPLGLPAVAAMACLATPSGEAGRVRCDEDSCTVGGGKSKHAPTTWVSLAGGEVRTVYAEARLPVGGGVHAFDAQRKRFSDRAGRGRPLRRPPALATSNLVAGWEWSGRTATCDLWLESYPEGDVLKQACQLR